MEIYIEKNILLDALQLIINISPKKTSEPIINNVLLETDDSDGSQSLHVKATNYESTFSGRFRCEINEPGRICVSTSKLFNLVKEFIGNRIFINATPQNWVYLTSGNSKVKLPGVGPNHFPVIEFKELEKTIAIPGVFLKSAIDLTYVAIGENESRKSLMGLNLEIVGPDKIHWTGADAYRICQYQTRMETPIEESGNIIIPKKSLTEIKRIIDFSDDTLFISFNENTFQIVTDQIKFKTSLIEAEYPNLNSLINSPILNPLHVAKAEIINAVRILNTVTDSDTNSIMKMTIQSGKMILESQKMEFGEGNDEIECDYSGKEMSIGLNIRFFLDALQIFEASGDEMVYINISSPEAPITLFCDEWTHFKTILMPVRIQW
ncbi:DNA polymerase III subunit beta [bacterium]|nr:DNA polymerase III subunit beta [bacterium]